MKTPLALLCLALAVGSAAAADRAAGQKIAEAQCAACHGKDYASPLPGYPKLAGQHDDYLLKSLQDYHSGARKNAIMAGIAKGLSRDDMRNVSAYLGALPGPLTQKK
jgi:cytochrome c553